MQADDRHEPINPRGREILAVAAKHLNTKSVSVGWFNEIALTLGLTRPALYKYAADREDLLFRCYSESCATLEARIDLAFAGGRDPVSALATLLTPPPEETAAITEIAALTPEDQEIIRGRLQGLEDRLAASISEGTSQGIFRELDAPIVAGVILGMISWIPLYRRWGPAAADMETVAQGSRELLFSGLSPDRRPPRLDAKSLAYTSQRPPNLFDRTEVAAAKRDRLLGAASGVFNTRGIGATRVEDVAAAVGMTKRAIYRAVGQKQELIEACVERAYAFFIELMEAGENMAAPRLDVLCTCMRETIFAELDPAIPILTAYVNTGQLGPEERARVADYAEILYDGYSRMIELGMTEGSVRPVPVQAIAVSLPGVVSWAANMPERYAAHSTRIADEVANLVARGILA